MSTAQQLIEADVPMWSVVKLFKGNDRTFTLGVPSSCLVGQASLWTQIAPHTVAIARA